MKRTPSAMAEIVNSDHIAVRDLPRQHQLLAKTPQDIRAASQIGANYFQRHNPVHFLVVSLKNGPHAAFAERFQDLVAATQNRAGHQRNASVGNGVGGREGLRPAWCLDGMSLIVISSPGNGLCFVRIHRRGCAAGRALRGRQRDSGFAGWAEHG